MSYKSKLWDAKLNILITKTKLKDAKSVMRYEVQMLTYLVKNMILSQNDEVQRQNIDILSQNDVGQKGCNNDKYIQPKWSYDN